MLHFRVNPSLRGVHADLDGVVDTPGESIGKHDQCPVKVVEAKLWTRLTSSPVLAAALDCVGSASSRIKAVK